VYKEVDLQAFDVSPDGRTLAVEFSAMEADKTWAIWVGNWDIASRKPLAQQRLEGPTVWSEILPTVQYQFNLRFMPDGQKLAAQTGRRIKVLDGVKLIPLYSISAPDTNPPPKQGIAIRRFETSGDGKLIAVLFSAAKSPCEPTSVGLFDTQTGKTVAEWTLPQACPHSISLSPDGSKTLLAGLTLYGSPEVLLANSRTGQILRSFDKEGVSASSNSHVGTAEFLGNDRFIDSFQVDMNTPDDLPNSTLNIRNLESGEVLQRLSYSVYGVRGAVALATRAPVVAVLGFGPVKPKDVLRDNDVRGFKRLLLFRLSDKEPFYVSPDISSKERIQTYPDPASSVQISSDGKVLAVFERGAVKVYHVADAR
jgi:hypothetical protein